MKSRARRKKKASAPKGRRSHACAISSAVTEKRSHGASQIHGCRAAATCGRDRWRSAPSTRSSCGRGTAPPIGDTRSAGDQGTCAWDPIGDTRSAGEQGTCAWDPIGDTRSVGEQGTCAWDPIGDTRSVGEQGTCAWDPIGDTRSVGEQGTCAWDRGQNGQRCLSSARVCCREWEARASEGAPCAGATWARESSRRARRGVQRGPARADARRRGSSTRRPAK
jgi:hypothetical protein